MEPAARVCPRLPLSRRRGVVSIEVFASVVVAVLLELVIVVEVPASAVVAVQVQLCSCETQELPPVSVPIIPLA
ncbi:hypothetical protein PF002_g29478 [Phytophthora fragariae]|uniref:Uncharacterized protein n=1 Tax=Phytophthora fragariae TaxID=53985 RepID=A0A6A3VT10_9STRA|nr:hypothetical protein PF002_g29478 [Phytophthora fragariae]